MVDTMSKTRMINEIARLEAEIAALKSSMTKPGQKESTCGNPRCRRGYVRGDAEKNIHSHWCPECEPASYAAERAYRPGGPTACMDDPMSDW